MNKPNGPNMKKYINSSFSISFSMVAVWKDPVYADFLQCLLTPGEILRFTPKQWARAKPSTP